MTSTRAVLIPRTSIVPPVVSRATPTQNDRLVDPLFPRGRRQVQRQERHEYLDRDQRQCLRCDELRATGTLYPRRGCNTREDVAIISNKPQFSISYHKSNHDISMDL